MIKKAWMGWVEKASGNGHIWPLIIYDQSLRRKWHWVANAKRCRRICRNSNSTRQPAWLYRILSFSL